MAIAAAGGVVECAAGPLVTFKPGERHAVQARTDARLLLILAPWPAAEHSTEAEAARGGHVAENAMVEPDRSFGAAE